MVPATADPTAREEIEDLRENDREVLEFLSRDPGSLVGFQGIRRRLRIHPEKLSRALQRLARDELVDRTDLGYRGNPKALSILGPPAPPRPPALPPRGHGPAGPRGLPQGRVDGPPPVVRPLGVGGRDPDVLAHGGRRDPARRPAPGGPALEHGPRRCPGPPRPGRPPPPPPAPPPPPGRGRPPAAAGGAPPRAPPPRAPRPPPPPHQLSHPLPRGAFARGSG